jgi:hypothetical protein
MKERMSEPLRQSFELPGGGRAVFTFADPDQIGFEVTPPPARFANRDEFVAFMGAYIVARRAFLEKVRALTGLRIAVVDELPGGLETVELPPLARRA